MEKVKERWVITRPSLEDQAMVAECLARLDRTPARSAIDDQGRYKLNSDEERAAQLAGFPDLLERLSAITDENDTDEMWEQFERNIDEERRGAGMRTLFDGQG